MNKHLVYPLVLFSFASPSNAQTTTFRGHTLGENWDTFIRTEKGLCRLNDANARACTQAAAGKDATLEVRSQDNVGEASVRFEGGHFVKANVLMKGPKFAELTHLEKTYGKPSRKTSNPEKGEAYSKWDFPDGGKVTANEYVSDSGQAIIRVDISSPEEALINTAADAADSCEDEIRLAEHPIRLAEMKKEAGGQPTDPWIEHFSDRHKQERLKQDEEDSLSWSPELTKGEYIKEKTGDMALVCTDEDIERSHRGLLVEGKGCIFVYPSLPVRTPMVMHRLRLAIAAYLEIAKPLETVVGQGAKQFSNISVADYTDIWLKVRDLYCSQNPGTKYIDLRGREGTCPAGGP